MRIKLYVIGILFLLSMGACVSYEPVELVNIHQATFDSLTTDGAFFSVKATIRNPNKYNISITTDNLVVSLNDNILGQANTTRKLVLKATTEQEYDIFLHSTIPPDGSIDVGTIALSSLIGQLHFKVEGEIKAKAKGISKNVPVKLEEKVKL